jgi:hypothetical protein
MTQINNSNPKPPILQITYGQKCSLITIAVLTSVGVLLAGFAFASADPIALRAEIFGGWAGVTIAIGGIFVGSILIKGRMAELDRRQEEENAKQLNQAQEA